MTDEATAGANRASGEPAFVPVADADHIPPGYSDGFEVDGEYIAVFNSDGELFAVEDRCPHMGVRLTGAPILEGGKVQCMLHGWTFRLNGCEARDGLKRYPVRLADGKLQLSATPCPKEQVGSA